MKKFTLMIVLSISALILVACGGTATNANDVMENTAADRLDRPEALIRFYTYNPIRHYAR